MQLVLIAALDRSRAIGRDNRLPWHLPDDLKRFKALTIGKPVLMGRKTAESLGRALPGRRNLVLTRAATAPFAGMLAVASLQAAVHAATAELADADGGDPGRTDTLCVIGGGEIYALCLPHATHMQLTHIDTVIEGAQAYFPAFDPALWQVTARRAHPADATHALAFEFVEYRRVAGIESPGVCHSESLL